MPPAVTHYDAIVIGSGQAGTPLARALAGGGRRTALIEREHVGGTCVNEGCTPTKTMVASARVAYLARRGADYGVGTGRVSIDMAAVRERKRRIVERSRGGSERGLARMARLDLHRGEARFSGPRAIDVAPAAGGTIALTGDLVFINTGCRPSRPNLAGLDGVPALDSTSIMELDAVPEHLLVLGGGYIGIEFGQMFRRFGAAVTIVQRGGQLLSREDPDVAQAVEGILRDDGIEVLLGAEARRVERTGDGSIRLTAREEGGGERTLVGSHLLLAAGRTPNSERLNLPAAGIETDGRGFIRVNDRLETSAAGVYGLGDVKGGPAFTHISYDDFRIVQALLDGRAASTKGRLVPYCVFMDPELGRVGLTETEARGMGRPVRAFTMPMSSVARATEMDETRGLMKAVVDTSSGQILGCAVLGVMGGEVMTAVEIAMMGRLSYTALRDAVIAHPVVAESLNNLFDQ